MGCGQRLWLTSVWKAASATLDVARQQLQRRMGYCSKAEFLVLTDNLDRASEEVDRTRAALDEHIRIHGCAEEQRAEVRPAAGAM